MSPSQPLISQIASDVLTGFYKRKRLTQEEVAERSDIPLTSLQKKLRGNAPISATDLVVISQAIGVDPTAVMAEILSELGERDPGMSDAPASLADHRKKKKPSEMTDEELDAFDGQSAANTDPELGYDEPDSP